MITTVRTRQVSEGGVTRSVASQSDARFGNTRKVTADDQAVSGTFVYDAFGTVMHSSGSPGLPNRYCGTWGYRDDGDAGLLHVGARYYDPTTGRFTTRDTLLTEHPYVYCDGDPVNAVDPDGCARVTLQWAVGMAQAVANRNWQQVETLLDAVLTDAKTSRLVVQAMQRANLPDKMKVVPENGALPDGVYPLVNRIVEHGDKLSGARSRGGILREITAFTKAIGSKLKAK